ncbi:MAG TPA: hypothetical protein VG894_03115 [Bauldia sp.]|nr:hypothetical protein [Bauldia sp.]
MKRYQDPEQVYDGEPIRVPRGRSWALVCCDCGLVHDIVIVDDGHEEGIRITFRRRPVETRQMRRRYPDFPCAPKAPAADRGKGRR